MKRAVPPLFCCLLVLLLWAAPLALARSLPLPAVLARGQVALFDFQTPAGVGHAAVFFLGKPQPVFRLGPGRWRAALAADLDTKPGLHRVLLRADGKEAARGNLKVVERDYGVRRITVAKKFMRLSKEQLDWHKRDLAAMRRAYALYSPAPLWQGAWQAPVPGPVTGIFGRRSVINGEPRSPHGGLDFRAAKGDPVLAPARGKVALVKDTYFGGLVVLIHHGAGVVSGYRHLLASPVKMGQKVEKGQVIGRVGMSGRVTGPHLHYDVHLAGARVDPAAWRALSGRLIGAE